MIIQPLIKFIVYGFLLIEMALYMSTQKNAKVAQVIAKMPVSAVPDHGSAVQRR